MTTKNRFSRAAAFAVAAAGFSALFAGPEQDFEKAYKEGRPLTAERAFKEIIEKNPNASVDLYYKAARIADETLKRTLLRDRLAYILRKDKTWNEKTAEAAAAACVYVGDAESFSRLAKAYPQSGVIRRHGARLIWKFRSEKRPADVLAMADAILGAYDDRWMVDTALYCIQHVISDRQPGFSWEDFGKLLLKHPKTADSPHIAWLLSCNNEKLPYSFRLNWCIDKKKLYDRSFFANRIAGDIWNNSIVVGDTNRMAEFKRFVDLEKVVFSSPTNDVLNAVSYFYCCARAGSKMYPMKGVPKDLRTAEWSKTALRLAEAVYKLGPKTKEEMQQVRSYVSGCLMDANVISREGLDRLRAKYPEMFTPEQLLNYGGQREKDNAAKTSKNVDALVAKMGGGYDYRIVALDNTAAYGSAESAVKTLEEYLLRQPRSFSAATVLNTLNSCKSMNAAAKTAFVKKMFRQIGYSKCWDPFAGDGWKKDYKDWVGAPAFDEVRAMIKAKNGPEHPYLKLWYPISEMKGFEAKAGQLMADALKLYNRPYKPATGTDPNPVETAMFSWIVGKYCDLAHRTNDGRKSFVNLFADKMTKDNGLWWYYENASGNLKDAAITAKYLENRIKICGENNLLSYYRLPKGSDTVPDWVKETLAKCDVASAYYFYYSNQSERMTDKGKVALFNEFWKSQDPAKMDEGWVNQVFSYVAPIAEKKKDIAAGIDFEPAAKKLLDTVCNRHYAACTLLAIIKNAKGVGEYAYVRRYLAALEKEEPTERLNALMALCGWRALLDWEKNAETKTEDLYGAVMKDKVLPLMKKIKDSEAAFVNFGDGWDFPNRMFDYQRLPSAKEDAGRAGWIDEICLETARLRRHAAQGRPSEQAYSYVYRRSFAKAFSTTNTFEMAKHAARLGRSWYGWIGGTHEFLELCNALKEAGCWESMYLLANAISTDDGSLSAAASRMRAEAAPKLPGIYPVSEGHPAYPLYVAADELSRKNSERAWDILQKNVPVFEREAGNLPPDFTAWAVDQLRMARGDQDSLLIKARNIATALLANEAKLTPALAAAMMLVRAESYRDQQNFEAAKLEYQSIRNNTKYNATPAGRRAMFRSVDLMIDMGNSSAAESTLEYWLSQPDVEVQAEAHYFLARIAFERKDYDETIKQLRETFALDFTHTEGRFLQGKWKLATNSEVDDTDVMIGTLADRTAIRPGQQLTISVQDRNLSVAGGGASIPVIVTTRPGNDVEKVYLYPSARDPNLFKGIIDVKLSKATVSNMVLEVTGRDTASYVIEPEFLKARGLPLNTPKILQVIDDAKLEIENETLRPGNPLYVTVEDKDRSLGGENDEVFIKVSTSSGDVLKAFPLKEEKRCSGVFRGEVKTSLPPPRAFASDTATGFNTGDVINEKKKGEWKSLADNQPGKWLEVDTMASHLMKTAKIAVPNPEEIREIALVGRLGTETLRLGSLPEEPVEKRIGLKFKTCWRRGVLRTEHDIRARFAAMGPRDYYTATVSNGVSFTAVAKKGQSVAQFCWYSGAFMPPKNVTFVRMRLMAKKTQGDTFRNLWVSVSVDGENVFSGQGPTLHGRIISFDVAPGAHQLEVFASCYREEDGFDLELVDDNGDGKPIPAEWFAADAHPELRDFLRDRAVIVRTNEGFVATFERPMRLRSLRWEFLKRTTPDVTVSAMEITDSKGGTVIPCATDFTDAQKNDTLEVAPGDKISVAYTDEITSLGEKRVIEKSINSSFNNAHVGFFYEEVVKSGNWAGLHLREAFRFHAGDKLLVGVYDPDMDATSGEDRLQVVVSSSGGEKKQLTLVEQNKDYQEFRRFRDINYEKRDGVHSGLFLGLLRTCDPASTNGANAAKAMKVSNGEALTLSYNDRENTNPGVPFVRQARVQCVKTGSPQIQFFHTVSIKEIDRSPMAMAKLEKIRRRPGNEQVKVLYRDVRIATPMDRKTCDSREPIDVNVGTPIPIRVVDPSRALHNTSKVVLQAVSDSEAKKAKEENREPEGVELPLVVGAPFRGFVLRKGAESPKEARRNGSFNGILELCLGAPDPNRIVREDDPPQLPVTGSDTVTVKVKDGAETILERRLRFVSNASLQLMDSTWSAERMAAHVGERFYVCVTDPDRDATDEQDKIGVVAVSLTGAGTNNVELTETLPHSGVFTGMYPSRKYGDCVVFTYNDERVLPGTALPRSLCVTGTVYSGSDGSVRLFSKRFRDNDTAVLVQFRLAECLFEQAKEFRKLKQADKAQEAIARGKYILEEALKNYPDSTHVVQGEYLLANLYQELATERKDAGDKSAATPLYTEALARFSSILSAWPDSEYAAKSQYHKALCLEMLGDYPRSSEEYVKMTYLYPDSELVGDATIRLATYYYKQEKRYDIAGRIYENFQKRFPTHEKAPRTLFMSGSCYVKQAEKVQKEYEEETKRTRLCMAAAELYLAAAKSFAAVAETYRESAPPAMRAQALYWTGDAYLRRGDFQQSYIFLKRTVFEYPETEWARRARGLLLQESQAFDRLEAQ